MKTKAIILSFIFITTFSFLGCYTKIAQAPGIEEEAGEPAREYRIYEYHYYDYPYWGVPLYYRWYYPYYYRHYWYDPWWYHHRRYYYYEPVPERKPEVKRRDASGSDRNRSDLETRERKSESSNVER